MSVILAKPVSLVKPARKTAPVSLTKGVRLEKPVSLVKRTNGQHFPGSRTFNASPRFAKGVSLVKSVDLTPHLYGHKVPVGRFPGWREYNARMAAMQQAAKRAS